MIQNGYEHTRKIKKEERTAYRFSKVSGARGSNETA